jgi:hypothetical protein
MDSLAMPEPEPTLDNASTGTESQWTDEMLLGQGWTQWQVDTWRAQQDEGDTNVAQTTSSPVQSESDAPLPSNHPAANFNFSDAVVAELMGKYGITDKSAFLTHAIDFDSNANNYLSGDELEKAAKSFSEQ